jgi:glycosyltransferase involved in cell wall biosynthesis
MAIRRSRAVIVICPHLAEVVRAIQPDATPFLIENAPGSGDAPVQGSGRAVRASLGLDAERPMVLYTGTFEAYQGLDLLFDAAAIVSRSRSDAVFVLVGGKRDQVERARREAAARGVADSICFIGERPAEEVPRYLDAADVLVSPRRTGTNTPLKIYQYLRSGRPIVATRLLTHTQVLSDEVALLTEATPAAFASGILQAIADRALAAELGRAARQLAETRYTYDAYLQKTREACGALAGIEPASIVAGRVA